MPQISVIVPVYKVEKYLPCCVDSILAQSFRDFELVLVDDGSPDQCPALCEEYAAKYNCITVIHKENGGLSDARNAGIEWAFANSNSRWLAFVDSDDYLHPDYLQNLYKAAAAADADLAVCDFVRISDEGERLDEPHTFRNAVLEQKNGLFDRLNTDWRIRPAWNKLYRKDIFSELRFPFGKIHEDEFIIHRVLWACKKAVLIGQGLYYYRTRPDSIMATPSAGTLLDGVEALLVQYEFSLDHGVPACNNCTGVEYMKELAQIKDAVGRENLPRYRALRRRYFRVYFSEKTNRCSRGAARFGLYLLLGKK